VKTIRSTAVTFAANLVSRGFSLASFLLLARLLDITQYSTLTILLSIVVTVSDLIGVGFNASIVRYTSLYHAQGEISKIGRLIVTNLFNTLLLYLVFFIGLVIFGSAISKILFSRDLSFLILYASLGVATTFVFSIFSAAAQGLERFAGLFLANVLFSLAKFVPIAGIVLFGTNELVWIVTVFVVAPLVPIGFLLWALRDFPLPLRGYDRNITKETFAFNRWMLLWAVCAILQSRIDVYLLGPLSQREQVAYYDMAQKVVSVVIAGVGAFATVLTPKIARLTNSLPAIRREMKSAIQICGVLTGVVLLLLLLAPMGLHLLFGRKYDNSVLPLQILLVSVLPFIWTTPLNAVINGLGYSKYFFLLALLALTINLVSSPLLIPHYGAIGSALTNLIINAIGFAFNFVFYRRSLRKFHSRIGP